MNSLEHGGPDLLPKYYKKKSSVLKGHLDFIVKEPVLIETCAEKQWSQKFCPSNLLRGVA